MKTQRFGHVVAISSAAGHVGTAKLTDYCASKFAVVSFMESLEAELRRNCNFDDIYTTIVCPYFVHTGLFGGVQTK